MFCPPQDDIGQSESIVILSVLLSLADRLLAVRYILLGMDPDQTMGYLDPVSNCRSSHCDVCWALARTTCSRFQIGQSRRTRQSLPLQPAATRMDFVSSERYKRAEMGCLCSSVAWISSQGSEWSSSAVGARSIKQHFPAAGRSMQHPFSSIC